MNLDDELRAALRREDPSPSFTEHVVARAHSSRAPKASIHRMTWAAALAAMLLIGGTKTGKDRWYEEFVPVADSIYDRHLRELEEEID